MIEMKKNTIIYLSILGVVILLLSLDSIITPTITESDITSANEYLKKTNNPRPPFPFTHDGCSLYPDVIPGHDFRDACLHHDIAYWTGGTAEERKRADILLREEISQSGFLGTPISYMMYFGVRVFGNSPVAALVDAEWGYGWDD